MRNSLARSRRRDRIVAARFHDQMPVPSFWAEPLADARLETAPGDRWCRRGTGAAVSFSANRWLAETRHGNSMGRRCCARGEEIEVISLRGQKQSEQASENFHRKG